jgi:hypothetical protein
LATTEDRSTYDDGKFRKLNWNIDLKTMKMNFTKKLSDTHKFEGLTLYRFSEKIQFLYEDKNRILETIFTN